MTDTFAMEGGNADFSGVKARLKPHRRLHQLMSKFHARKLYISFAKPINFG